MSNRNDGKVALNGNDREKMNNAVKIVFGCLALVAVAFAQEQPRELRGGGHKLDETVQQFYSEEYAGNLLSACQAHNWKIVSHMYKAADPSSKLSAKEICAMGELIKKRASDGARLEFKGSGDAETQRTDTFTFDKGRLVKIRMVYGGSTASVEGIHPKTYVDLVAGLQEAYGPPTKTSIESTQDSYGVKYESHRAEWAGKENIITITERPGMNGSTEIVAETIGESKAPKPANPLQ
jgi:hypothetical protein